MTTLILDKKVWRDLQQRITSDYGIVVAMISWKTKETLGFTVRHHQGHNPINGHRVNDIRLDFVDQDAATFFRLKYL